MNLASMRALATPSTSQMLVENTWRSTFCCSSGSLLTLTLLFRYGAKAEDFAEIGRISHEHSTRNPYAQFQQEYTLKEVMDSTMIHSPVTKLQCSPTSDGSGAAVIVSERFLNARAHLKSQAILMAGQQLQTDDPSLFSKVRPVPGLGTESC